MESSVKSPALTMRILKYAMVVSGFMFIYIAFTIPVQPQQPVSQAFEIAITCVALACVIAGFVLPRILLQTASSTAQDNSTEAQLKKWFSKGVLSLAFFEACILFGFVLHLLQARVRLVEFLFGLGIAAELFCSPGPLPSAENREFSPN